MWSVTEDWVVAIGYSCLSGAGKTVYAPIPGAIDSITAQPGDVVAVGQDLVVLETMKMKNAIRASRVGEIGKIHVTIGQQVRHNDAMIEYV